MLEVIFQPTLEFEDFYLHLICYLQLNFPLVDIHCTSNLSIKHASFLLFTIYACSCFILFSSWERYVGDVTLY